MQLLALIKEYFDEATFEEKHHDLQRLCHELRTPVNHIVGYAELLEELADERSLAHACCPTCARSPTPATPGWDLMEEYLIRPPVRTRPASPGWGARGGADSCWSPVLISPRLRPAARLPGAHGSRDTLLVADDDAANREMLARRLQRQGYQRVVRQQRAGGAAIVARPEV